MRFLVTGGTGILGGWLLAELARQGAEAIAPRRDRLELTKGETIATLLEAERPDAVIHAAALATIADCARDPARARAVNVDGTAHVAQACAARGIRLVHVSTDLVFEGEAAPYDEAAEPAPLSVYGWTKLDAEREALRANGAAIVRVSLLFGPTQTSRRGFFDAQLASLRRGEPIPSFDDEWRTPLSLRACAEGLVAIARGGLAGLVHLGGPERLSRWEMGLALARAIGADVSLVTRATRTSVPGEPRPRDVSLVRSAFDASFPGIAAAPFAEECRRMGIRGSIDG